MAGRRPRPPCRRAHQRATGGAAHRAATPVRRDVRRLGRGEARAGCVAAPPARGGPSAARGADARGTAGCGRGGDDGAARRARARRERCAAAGPCRAGDRSRHGRHEPPARCRRGGDAGDGADPPHRGVGLERRHGRDRCVAARRPGRGRCAWPATDCRGGAGVLRRAHPGGPVGAACDGHGRPGARRCSPGPADAPPAAAGRCGPRPGPARPVARATARPAAVGRGDAGRPRRGPAGAGPPRASAAPRAVRAAAGPARRDRRRPGGRAAGAARRRRRRCPGDPASQPRRRPGSRRRSSRLHGRCPRGAPVPGPRPSPAGPRRAAARCRARDGATPAVVGAGRRHGRAGGAAGRRRRHRVAAADGARTSGGGRGRRRLSGAPGPATGPGPRWLRAHGDRRRAGRCLPPHHHTRQRPRRHRP